MEDEAEIWHTCLGYYPLQNFCFLFGSDKHHGCYGNLKFPYTYNGKSAWKLTISAKSLGIFEFFIEMFIE